MGRARGSIATDAFGKVFGARRGLSGDAGMSRDLASATDTELVQILGNPTHHLRKVNYAAFRKAGLGGWRGRVGLLHRSPLLDWREIYRQAMGLDQPGRGVLVPNRDAVERAIEERLGLKVLRDAK